MHFLTPHFEWLFIVHTHQLYYEIKHFPKMGARRKKKITFCQ